MLSREWDIWGKIDEIPAKKIIRCNLSNCRWFGTILSFGDRQKTYYLSEHCTTCIHLSRKQDNYEKKKE